jgi:hypothetical protein
LSKSIPMEFPLPPTHRIGTTQQKQKARCAVGVSGLGFPISALRLLSVVLRRHAHRMMMVMVTAVVQRGHTKEMLRRPGFFSQSNSTIVVGEEIKGQRPLIPCRIGVP